MKKKVTTYFLKSTDKNTAPVALSDDLLLIECEETSPEFMQFLFKSVGQHWNWYSRLGWDFDTWQAYLDKPNVRNWVLYRKGSPVGYFELVSHQDNTVEIMFFGLIAQFYGQKLGALLLSCAIEQAWLMNPTSVWLHTCSEDHPHALNNYKDRGFELFKTSEKLEDVPEMFDKQKLTEEFTFSVISKYN